MSPVTTSIDHPTAKLFVEVTDGELTTLQIARTQLDPLRHEEVAAALASVIDSALLQHRDDLLADLAADLEQDPAMSGALEFLSGQLDTAPVLPEPDPLVSATGTAQDGQVRAVVGDGRLATLDFPADLLQPSGGRTLEKAIVAAVNEALASVQSAVPVAGLEAPAEPDWAALAGRIRRLAREDLL